MEVIEQPLQTCEDIVFLPRHWDLANMISFLVPVPDHRGCSGARAVQQGHHSGAGHE